MGRTRFREAVIRGHWWRDARRSPGIPSILQLAMRPCAQEYSASVGIFEVLPRTTETREGRLTIGGVALADVAAEFGTPAFVVDEEGLRATAREYLEEFTSRHARTDVHFASKALPCAPVTRILADEGLGCDVASAGELAIALAAGFDPEHILLHGNAKSDTDIGDALDAGVGMIVIDGSDDVDRLERLATMPQRVLLRVNPAVPGETHAAMDTGSPEAKFGVSLEEAPTPSSRRMRLAGQLELLGLHVHIGSQLLDLEGFGRAAEALAALGRFPIYDLGGGLGIAYRPGDQAPTIAGYAEATVKALHEHLDPAATLIVEPGRSVVGRSMVTLYEVITVKRGRLTHVAVNGGMGDNLEPMLYGQRFAPFILDGGAPAGDVRAGRPPLRERRRARTQHRAVLRGRRPARDAGHRRLLLLALQQLQRRPPPAGRALQPRRGHPGRAARDDRRPAGEERPMTRPAAWYVFVVHHITRRHRQTEETPLSQEISNFIHGKRVAAADGQTTDLVDPSTGEVYASAPLSRDADIDAAFQDRRAPSRAGATPRRASANVPYCGSPTPSRSAPRSWWRSSRRTPASRSSSRWRRRSLRCATRSASSRARHAFSRARRPTST